MAMACTACGLPPEECRCTPFRDELLREADVRARAGRAALREGRLHAGLRLLAEAHELADPDDDARAALGLAALATGDPQLAREAWRGCAEEHDARRWLAALEESGGPIRRALEAYNTALDHAAAGRLEEALPLAREATAKLRGFVPAHRLLGLILAARGRIDEAREAWRVGLETCADDESLLGYMARTSLEAGRAPAAPIAAAGEPGAAANSRGGRNTRRLTLAALWLITILGAWNLAGGVGDGGGADREAIDEAGSRTAAPNVVAAEAPAAEPAVAPALPPAAASPLTLSGYRLGRLADREGEWRSVVYHLESARTTDPDIHYVDDALYLLARAYAELGEPEAAREVARQILAEHPSSIFANSITHALAREVTQ